METTSQEEFLIVDSPSVPSERDKEMYAMRCHGMSLGEIGDKFNVSRQYVDQQCKGFLLHFPVQQRRALKEVAAKEFLERLGPRICLYCSNPIATRSSSIHDSCLKRLRILRSVKCLLLNYRKNGIDRLLNQAMYRVRKYAIKPEEIERV